VKKPEKTNLLQPRAGRPSLPPMHARPAPPALLRGRVQTVRPVTWRTALVQERHSRGAAATQQQCSSSARPASIDTAYAHDLCTEASRARCWARQTQE